MSDFTFTSTAECELCGAHMSSSNAECDHGGNRVENHLFRRLNSTDTISVKSTGLYKWEKLSENVDEWIAYQYLGPRESVESMLSSTLWSDVSDVPIVQHSASSVKKYEQE